jgi:8-oxo-dGTP diphosphatase
MSDQTPRPKASIAVAVVERADCYLVGRRPAGVPLAGLWEFPGGKVEPAETPEEAASRECLEETGIAVEVETLYDIVEHDYRHGAVRLYFFGCKPLEPATEPKPPFQWLAAANVAALPFPPANAAILRRLKLC